MSRDLLTLADQQALLREREADHFHDECGIFGVHGHPEAANITYLGLYALQHRGQESCGIVSSTGREQFVHRAMGLVADVFGEKTLEKLPGRHAIGHVRYSTAGGSHLRNAQPFYATTDGGPVAIAHNGNLVNANTIRRELEGRGAIFSTTADSEVIVQLLARSREQTLEERLIDSLSRVKGAFSLVVLTRDALIAARDPHGFRPLSLGRLDGAWVAASETCALDLIGAEHERDLDPGEVVVIRRGRLRTLRPFTPAPKENFCIFEYIYFARPDSNLNRQNVYSYRKELGRMLAREHPVAADLVVPVLDSGNTAALGFAEESGIPYEQAMIRNHYVRRTFIEPAQSIRHFGVKVKHNAVRGLLQGKRVILVDDSIVRGTTLIKLVSMLRQAGAREVHARISSPPTIGPCYYGIDTPTREELIANQHSVDGIREIIGADTIGYLSLEGLHNVSKSLKHGYCDACFSDNYPIPVSREGPPPQLSLFREIEEGGS
ncbi:MAG: amidophosphoribosyltransferase [Acidobacteria bacterium]|nr:MAG: amidophosphoribosyltransferase [Acidobacteriota bacterium]TDJ19706.1 MAG: amidophosphoribosyltransferase [Deltaproteobacteria bacterium]